MQQNPELEKILEKISKLLAKAESTDNQAEAEAFMAKVNELLTTYNLTLMDVNAKNRADSEKSGLPNDEFPLSEYIIKTEGKWVVQLFHGVCKFNYCMSVSMNGRTPKDTSMWVTGEEANIQTSKALFDYLWKSGKRLKANAWKEYQNGPGIEKKNTFTRGFYIGYVQALRNRFHDLKVEREQANCKVTDLMVVNDKALEKSVKEHFGNNLGRSRGGSSKGAAGVVRGRQAGNSISLNKQIR